VSGGRPAFDLDALFAPRSIAVVGASPRSDLATTVRDNIGRVGGQARCYFVNPRYEAIDGTPCHPDLAALPEVPDTVLIGVNPLRAAALTREAAAAGVPSVIIPGGGVVEGGEAAARMQAEVRDVAAATGIAVLGPNCMGIVDLTTSSATYIDDLPPTLRRGPIAGIAQSGSVTDAFIHAGPRIGWSRIVSCGAEVVLDLCDYLAHAIEDPETEAILLFIEGLKRPDRFLALADRALAAGKPIFAVKVGRSRQAQAAAVAHTGSLAGEDRVVDAAFEATGVVRCDDLDDLLEAGALLTGARRLGRRAGLGRTGVITVSTGEGSLVADLAGRTGLDLPPIPKPAERLILEALPTLGYVGNPLDPWGAGDGAATYRTCFEAFAGSGAFDVLAFVHDFPFRSQPGEVALATELAAELVAATADRPEILPVYVSLTSGDATPEVLELLDAAGGVPALRGTGPAFHSIARLAAWEGRQAKRRIDGPVRPAWVELAASTPRHITEPGVADASGTATTLMGERAALAELAAAGVPVVTADAVAIVDPADPGARRVASDEAVGIAARIGGRVVLKLDADVAHKTELGGVIVGVQPADVPAAVARLLDAAVAAGLEIRGLLVEPEVPAGVELIVGARRDPGFGPVVAIGFGGVLAEMLDDVVLRLAPVSPAAAGSALASLRGAPILAGLRGRPGIDQEAVAELISRFSKAFVDRPEWLEAEMNPVIAGPQGAIAVDALIVRAADVAGRPHG
jgi:acetate---CoA ligase (ADP-forming)